MAFLQLLIGGLALATRFHESRQAKTVIKEVPKLVVVRIPTPVTDEEKSSPVVSRPPVAAIETAQTAALPEPTPVAAPPVADPRSERLVKEAGQARVAGDMGRAIVKLEEALLQSPDDPTVHFELGRVHEQMGVFDVATEHYNKVYLMGSDAGSLYPLAAAKVREGFVEEDFHGKLSLGRVRIYPDPDTEDGQRVIVTIPVQKAPGEEIEVAEMSVSVTFFNRTSKGEIVERDDDSTVKDQWVTMPFDWSGGEESLRMTYMIPPQDISTAHLFGGREYYGQVVTLLYKGEVLDVQAWPRDLAARIPRSQSANPPDMRQPEFQDSLPADFDPNLGVLPPLPNR